jgi:hypothetical protein
VAGAAGWSWPVSGRGVDPNLAGNLNAQPDDQHGHLRPDQQEK